MRRRHRPCARETWPAACRSPTPTGKRMILAAGRDGASIGRKRRQRCPSTPPALRQAPPRVRVPDVNSGIAGPPTQTYFACAEPPAMRLPSEKPPSTSEMSEETGQRPNFPACRSSPKSRRMRLRLKFHGDVRHTQARCENRWETARPRPRGNSSMRRETIVLGSISWIFS